MSDQAHFEIRVSDQQNCTIEVRSAGLQQLAQVLRDDLRPPAVVIVSDANVDRIYGQTVVGQFARLSSRVESVVLPIGESTKSAVRLHELWSRFAQWQLHRDAVIVALGGGVIGDLAGFAAATYTRGLQWIGLPTSLMAQVDSSIGGKVGINLESAKNIVGAFWQPTQVIIDPTALGTLSDRDFRSGLAEVVKYAVISGPTLWDQLDRNGAAILAREPSALRNVIVECCAAKVAIVSADPLERNGQRAVLNFGHTFGHALETVLGYGELSHGEAVAIGMVCASRLAEQIGLAEKGLCSDLRTILAKFGLPTEFPQVSHDEILQVMSLDKKNRAGKLRLVLAKRIGHVELAEEVDPSAVLAALQTGKSY